MHVLKKSWGSSRSSDQKQLKNQAKAKQQQLRLCSPWPDTPWQVGSLIWEGKNCWKNYWKKWKRKTNWPDESSLRIGGLKSLAHWRWFHWQGSFRMWSLHQQNWNGNVLLPEESPDYGSECIWNCNKSHDSELHLGFATSINWGFSI